MEDQATLPRDTDGKLTAYAWPGGYAVQYLMDDGETICAQCANGENGSDASENADPRSGWQIVAHYIHWEGPTDYCAHCSAEMPSEYGDPDAEDDT